MIPESPKYLYSKKDWARLHQNLNTIAFFNGKSTFRKSENSSINNLSRHLLPNEEAETAVSDRRTEEYSVLVALKDRKTFVNLVAVII